MFYAQCRLRPTASDSSRCHLSYVSPAAGAQEGFPSPHRLHATRPAVLWGWSHLHPLRPLEIAALQPQRALLLMSSLAPNPCGDIALSCSVFPHGRGQMDMPHTRYVPRFSHSPHRPLVHPPCRQRCVYIERDHIL